MESTAQMDKERTSKIARLEKSILAMNKKQDYERCFDVHDNIPTHCMDAKKFGPNNQNGIKDNELGLDFSHIKDKKFAQKLMLCKLFDTDALRLYNISMKNKKVLEFCALSFPDKVDILYISPLFQAKQKNGSTYFNFLIRNSYKVVCMVFLICFTLNISQLKRLVAAYKHLNILGFNSCKLSISSVPDLSKALINCKLKTLSCENSTFSS
ncbi:unnamed protein product [Moneuplotes crassus]|uniref:Uncharacterized protein n=1 Tax=Euplotes crassus TaxID=5936 RepID=A0AAD1XF92_EUPCR|nr:unnamed protein product [Moneuplotes crassus]